MSERKNKDKLPPVNIWNMFYFSFYHLKTGGALDLNFKNLSTSQFFIFFFLALSLASSSSLLTYFWQFLITLQNIQVCLYIIQCTACICNNIVDYYGLGYSVSYLLFSSRGPPRCRFLSTSDGPPVGLADAETIFALSSGHGRCGVAVVRASGPASATALKCMVGLTHGLPPPRTALLRSITDPQTKEVLDRGLVLWFPGWLWMYKTPLFYTTLAASLLLPKIYQLKTWSSKIFHLYEHLCLSCHQLG